VLFEGSVLVEANDVTVNGEAPTFRPARSVCAGIDFGL